MPSTVTTATAAMMTAARRSASRTGAVTGATGRTAYATRPAIIRRTATATTEGTGTDALKPMTRPTGRAILCPCGDTTVRPGVPDTAGPAVRSGPLTAPCGAYRVGAAS